MNTVREIPWPRIFAEGTAIVVSILLAFWIQAWWDDKQQRDEEHELLQALLDDFVATKEEIQNWRAFHIAVEKSTKTLLDVTLSNDRSQAEGDIRQLISNLTWFDAASHFATGALNSTMNGGDLPKIQNQSLRRQIADWPTRIANAESIQSQDYEFFVQVLAPFLRANTSLPQLSSENNVRPGDSATVFPQVTSEYVGDSEIATLLNVQGFENILMQKSWIQFDILDQIDEVEGYLDQTIAALTEELLER